MSQVPRGSRRSLRWAARDYAAPGAYFVTICVANRECRFGFVRERTMWMSALGGCAAATWESLPTRFPRVSIDRFVVMPNHIHGLLQFGPESPSLTDPGEAVEHASGDRRAPTGGAPTAIQRPGDTLGIVVGTFKSIVSSAWIRACRATERRPPIGPLWHRNFHDRVVRDEAELCRIRSYIDANVDAWADDPENPEACTPRDG